MWYGTSNLENDVNKMRWNELAAFVAYAITFAGKMKYLAICICLVGLSACDKVNPIDEEAILKWGSSGKAQAREHGETYMFYLDDGSCVSISTSKMEETDKGLMYSGGEILETGYYIYPGGRRAASIQEAIRLCKKIEGAHYISDQDGADHPASTPKSK